MLTRELILQASQLQFQVGELRPGYLHANDSNHIGPDFLHYAPSGTPSSNHNHTNSILDSNDTEQILGKQKISLKFGFDSATSEYDYLEIK